MMILKKLFDTDYPALSNLFFELLSIIVLSDLNLQIVMIWSYNTISEFMDCRSMIGNNNIFILRYWLEEEVGWVHGSLPDWVVLWWPAVGWKQPTSESPESVNHTFQQVLPIDLFLVHG